MQFSEGWRDSWPLALLEFILVALLFVADAHHLIPVSKTPELVLLGWISLRFRHLKWRDVGLEWKLPLLRTVALGAAGGIALELIELYVTQPLLVHITHRPPDLSDFNELRGNFKLMLLGLALTWTLGAFGGEMAWRGWLMNRVAGLGHKSRAAWIVSLLLVNAAFGMAHAYQGITGIMDEGFMGLLLGLIFLLCGENLWIPIVAHGVQDSIDVLLLYSGHYPFPGLK
jgi:membrane protease YdiL (CAAX protease family)